MIKNTELRIGSIVNASETGYYPVVVIAIEEHGIKYYYEGEKTGKSFDFIYPIPLTSEILEKAGFRKVTWSADENVYEECFTCQLKKDGLHILDNDFINLKPLQSVHHLQNLYFDLSEKELEINI